MSQSFASAKDTQFISVASFEPMQSIARTLLRTPMLPSLLRGSRARLLSSMTVEQASAPMEATARRKSIVVVGAGRMGAIRARNVFSSPSFELAGVVDGNAARSEEVASKYGVGSFQTLEEAIEQHDLDAVWIAAPTPFHKDLIKLAAANGIAVGVEKPVCDNEADIQECYDICAQMNVPLMCSFQRRYDPNYTRLVQLVRNNELGQLKSIHTVFRDFPVPPVEFLLQGGCIFHDCAVHDIDFVRYLTGEEPCEVFAKGTSTLAPLKEKGVADQCHVMFTFPSGLVCTMEVARASPFGYDNRIEVCGSDGVAQVQNVPGTSLVHSRGPHVMAESPVGSFPERYQQAYQNEVDSFAEVLFARQQPLISCRDALRATRLAEAARQSAKTGKPVAIPAL